MQYFQKSTISCMWDARLNISQKNINLKYLLWKITSRNMLTKPLTRSNDITKMLVTISVIHFH